MHCKLVKHTYNGNNVRVYSVFLKTVPCLFILNP